MLAVLSSRQIAEWMAYDQIDPIDPETRADWRAGMVAATVANFSPNRGKKALKVEDFMPKFGKRKPVDMKAALSFLGAAFGGLKRGKSR